MRQIFWRLVQVNRLKKAALYQFQRHLATQPQMESQPDTNPILGSNPDRQRYQAKLLSDQLHTPMGQIWLQPEY